MLPELEQRLTPAFPELGTALRQAIPQICGRHSHQVREHFPAAARLSDDDAQDDLPDILEAFVTAFSQIGGLTPLIMLGPAHAAAREGQGFSIGDVVEEYLLLRLSLHQILPQALNRELTRPETAALDAAIDTVITATTASFNAQREARLQLENTATSNYLVSLSHDLRNEINGLLASFESLQEQGLRLQELASEGSGQVAPHPESLRFMEEVQATKEAIESSIAATSRLLASERLRGTRTADKRRVDLLKLLQGVARSTARLAAHPSRTPAMERFSIHCTPDLTLWTDPDLLGTVLSNLVGNAVKYAPDSPIDIHVRIEGGACEIAVRDQGPGIPSEKLAVIFDKFQRAGGLPQGGLGLGLGLFIARRAVGLLGGHLRVESQLQQGTTFFVELPDAQPAPFPAE